jgi:N-acetylmuramoyl-L-alanine amidase
VYILGESRSEESLAVAKRENSVILLEENQAQKYEGFDPNSSESNIIFELIQNIYVEQSFNFASMVQKQLVKTSNRHDRGVRQAGFWVLVGAAMPRILIELDFISNLDSEKFLNSPEGQAKMARAIANAFLQFKKEYDNRKAGSIDLPMPVANTELNNTEVNTVNRDNTQKAISATANANRIYKVQILASPKKLEKNSRELKGYQADYYFENKLYKYTFGETSDWTEIAAVRKSLLKDFKDAFIITFENGVKIPNK